VNNFCLHFRGWFSTVPDDRYFFTTLSIVDQSMSNKSEIYDLLSFFLFNYNKGNAKRGVSLRLKIRPCDLDLWPWKSIGFQILLRSKYVPSLVKIHWRMLNLVFTRMLCSKNLTRWHWPLTYDLENQ
jgi:hypothetical protein